MDRRIPYADITENADRHWTCRLLERLAAPDLPDAEVVDLVAALEAVSDPRSLGPLETTLCDTDRPARVREAAGSHLRGMQYLVPDVQEAKPAAGGGRATPSSAGTPWRAWTGWIAPTSFSR